MTDPTATDSLREKRDKGPMRTRSLRRISAARDGRAGLYSRRFGPAQEADLLTYAASVSDEDILGWRDTGPAILHWIRTHQPDDAIEFTIKTVTTPDGSVYRPDATSTFGEVIKLTGWHVEIIWNWSANWWTARLVSLLDRNGKHTDWEGGYLVPFDDPIGASGATPEEALSNLSDAVLEWA